MKVNIPQSETPEETVKLQVSIPAAKWRRARSYAALLDKTNQQVVEEAVELWIRKVERAA